MSLEFSLGVGEGTSSSSARIDRGRMSVESDGRRSPTSSLRTLSAVRFVDADARELACRDAAAHRSIVLRPRADWPGGLAAGIDGDLESALALRGALPSSLGDSATLEDRLGDQLSRAACVPVKGVCLALPPLGACAEADGVLSDVDARYLHAWLSAALAKALPIAILFDGQDRALSLRVPRTLDAVVGDLRQSSPETRRYEDIPLTTSIDERLAALAADDALLEDHGCVKSESNAADDRISIPDLVDMVGSDGPVTSHSVFAEPASDVEAAVIASITESTETPAIAPAHQTDVASSASEMHLSEAEITNGALYRAKAPPVFARPRRSLEARSPKAPKLEEAAREVEAPKVAAKPGHKSLASVMSETLRPPSEVVMERAPVVEESQSDEERVLTAAHWRAQAIELDEARGPKPVSAIERLFAQRYLPLVGALQRNEADHAVGSVVEQWAQSFAESYTDSFSTLKVTSRRPTMVLDAFDVASKIARLSSARTVKLLLVDSMSFDMAERVAARMKIILDKRAVLVERTTLWSALPTTTPTQMALLGRGPDALRDAAPASSSEPDVARGRNIASLRRERVGSRELMKLDLVEARLRSPGASYDERLDSIADEVTEVIIKLMETLPPRTLLYVFGDHGFVLGHGSNGWATGPATQGGASPDEVLVAGHAWLVDAMQ